MFATNPTTKTGKDKTRKQNNDCFATPGDDTAILLRQTGWNGRTMISPADSWTSSDHSCGEEREIGQC